MGVRTGCEEGRREEGACADGGVDMNVVVYPPPLIDREGAGGNEKGIRERGPGPIPPFLSSPRRFPFWP